MLRILKISLLVSVVVLLNAMTTLLFVQNAVPASAGPQCVTGDVNDDAAVDLGDPVYLLSYLFQGGPEPVACAQQPVATAAFKLVGGPNPYTDCDNTDPQSFPPCGEIPISFISDTFDSGMLDPVSSTITIQEPGIYHLHIRLNILSAWDNAFILIKKNGVTISEARNGNGWSGNLFYRSLSTIERFDQGDVIQFLYQPDWLFNSPVYWFEGDAFGYKVSD
jgi:hypothetical protein